MRMLRVLTISVLLANIASAERPLGEPVPENALADAVGAATGKPTGKKPTAARPQKQEEAQKAIRAVLDAQAQAWNKGDLEAYMLGYWKSSELTFFSGASETSGWRQTLERYRLAYKSEGKQMGKLVFDDVRIDMLTPNGAFVRTRWNLEMSGGQQTHGVDTLILRKMSDGWRIVHDHSSAAGD